MDFDNSKPIYIQIIDDIKKKLVRGELKLGDKILSQRDFAKEIQVNPNTVQRAYREMESIGIVKTLRGQGTFLCEDSQILENLKKEMSENIIISFIKDMKSLGFENDEVIVLIKSYLNKELI